MMKMQKDWKIAVTDLDGTLLDENHGLSIGTRKVLMELQNHNKLLIVATGRHYKEVQEIFRLLKVSSHIISSNGGVILDVDGKIMKNHTIPFETVKRLIHCIDDEEIGISVYAGDKWYLDRDTISVLDFCQTTQFFPEMVNFATDELNLHCVNKVFFIGLNPEKLEYVIELIEKMNLDDVTAFYSSSCSLDVMPKNVNKGVAMEEVASTLHLTVKDCIAFGDGINDLEMLQMAGMGFMMGNAPERVKKLCPAGVEFVKGNDEDGVAIKLLELLTNPVNH